MKELLKHPFPIRFDKSYFQGEWFILDLTLYLILLNIYYLL